MLVLDGKSVFGGIAIGKIALFEKGDDPVKRKTIEDTNEEIKRFENAKEKDIPFIFEHLDNSLTVAILDCQQ